MNNVYYNKKFERLSLGPGAPDRVVLCEYKVYNDGEGCTTATVSVVYGPDLCVYVPVCVWSVADAMALCEVLRQMVRVSLRCGQ